VARSRKTFCWIWIATPGDPQIVYEVDGPMVGWWLDEIEKALLENPLDLADFPPNTGGVFCRISHEEDGNEYGSAHWWNIEPVEPLRVEIIPDE
jgi:hypothetical protein